MLQTLLFRMILFRLILLITSLMTLERCVAQVILPKNLDEAVSYFQKEWTTSELEEFKNKSERDAVTELHFVTGQWIRNNWVRGSRDTALTNYFHHLGIYHPEDISSIILTSLHRTLNKRDIALDKQIESYKAYWKPIFECREKQKAEAIHNYSKFKIGDTVTIYMPVDTAFGSRNAVLYDCPTPEWTFDSAKDLVLKGRIVKKYFINKKENVFFSVHVNYMNRTDIQILMTDVRTGDNKDFSLTGLTIK